MGLIVSASTIIKEIFYSDFFSFFFFFFSFQNRTFCLNFIRSTPHCQSRTDSRTIVREQFNGNTHFLDQSTLYGSMEPVTTILRQVRQAKGSRS